MLAESGEECLDHAQPQAGRCRPARHLAARHRRTGGAGAHRRHGRSARSHHDLGPRQHRDRGSRHQTGGVRLPGKAALARTHAHRPEERHRRQASAQRKPRIQEAVPGPQRDRRRQHPDEGAAAADRADGADQRTRADLRRVRHRQGTGGARHPRAEPAQGRDVRRGELRRHSGRPDRERAVRASRGIVPRRHRPTRKASSRRPTAGRCSSTKSAT